MNSFAKVVLSCVLVALVANVSLASEAPPPLGLWRGSFDDGSGTVTLSCQPGGRCLLHIVGAPAVGGNWTWSPTSTGGIITVHYLNAGRPSRLYYSVTYINSNSLIFSDPFFRMVLRRQ